MSPAPRHGVPPPQQVAVALGSNLGDRRAHLLAGVAGLRELLTGVTVSRFVETPPLGVGPQPAYLNAAVVGWTSASPQEILAVLLAIERTRGRTRPFAGAPRTLDLDLILHGKTILWTPALVIPHPRFRDRRFVLDPLAAIAPELVDPVTGQTIQALLARLTGASRSR